MKKEYIMPEILVEEILIEGMLAASNIQEGEDNQPLDVNERRGGWGNLWD